MRFENWVQILTQKMLESEKDVFVWGLNDCCLWTADIVYSMTGIDYAADFRGTYNTEDAAYLALGDLTMKERVTSKLGIPLHINMAQRGDVVMLIADGKQTLGICVGAKAAFKTPTGLIHINIFNCECVWRIS